ncbi:hypothetical protein [Shewanella sp.]|uniref:hypothetical protein n=1 Tax=Shewanella sp. TaxID=50422 RepID=UPI001EC47722|nr:hypothetical protein [Shewanella sp.]NRB22383.1 hypothetical protein [Shewanella sp.]
MKYVVILWFFVSFNVLSVEISTLFLVTDEGGRGHITITNDAPESLFLISRISEILVSKDKLTSTPYTRDNVGSWDFSVYPARAVLYPNMAKAFRVECKSDCTEASQRDRVFKVDFSPAPYTPPGGLQQGTNTELMIGFSPYIVVPAKESKMDYSFSYDGETLSIHNKGNTLAVVHVTNCEKGQRSKQCEQRIHVLSGRQLHIKLRDLVRADELDVIVTNHNRQYRQSHTVKISH